MVVYSVTRGAVLTRDDLIDESVCQGVVAWLTLFVTRQWSKNVCQQYVLIGELMHESQTPCRIGSDRKRDVYIWLRISGDMTAR